MIIRFGSLLTETEKVACCVFVHIIQKKNHSKDNTKEKDERNEALETNLNLHLNSSLHFHPSWTVLFFHFLLLILLSGIFKTGMFPQTQYSMCAFRTECKSKMCPAQMLFIYKINWLHLEHAGFMLRGLGGNLAWRNWKISDLLYKWLNVNMYMYTICVYKCWFKNVKCLFIFFCYYSLSKNTSEEMYLVNSSSEKGVKEKSI